MINSRLGDALDVKCKDSRLNNALIVKNIIDSRLSDALDVKM